MFQGIHTPTRCPTGTFSNSTMLTSADNCTAFTVGFYTVENTYTKPLQQVTQNFYPLLTIVLNILLHFTAQFALLNMVETVHRTTSVLLIGYSAENG
ncbi:hypothetical protein MAR_027190 [Mya arenaria]|uniref:Uncharacterized protein n=1 Tax=Mya arenaria TaxID=6604 RepID=A0ABY7ESQ5_MYAAR|nr:hypothetical protein MAR_027190 [Mya arenaria]